MTAPRKPAVVRPTPEPSPVAMTAQGPEPSSVSAGEGSNTQANGHPAQATSNGGAQLWPDLNIVDVRASAPDALGGLPPGASPLLEAPKRRGRPPGSKTRRLNPDAPQDIPGPRVAQSHVITQADYRTMATLTVRTTTGLLAQVFGPEWVPTEPEDTALIDASENYFRAKGIPDIPPGWILFFVVSTYALPRLNSPNMREKLGKVGDGIKSTLGLGRAKAQ
jgi:hypothetical protein